MNSTLRFVLLVPALVASCALPTSVSAQHKSGPWHVVSIDPYGLANQRLTAEAEFCDKPGGAEWEFGCSATAGLATTIERHRRTAGSAASRHHVDAEGFVRFGNRERLRGWWLGLRTGLTFADRYGLRPNVGVETGMSWLIARRLYVGTSVGAKKVFLLDDDADLRYNPSLRIAAGYAF